MEHDLLSIYPAKMMEYCLAIGYLLLFVPFWKYVQGGRPAAADARAERPARASTAARAAAGAVALPRPAGAGWFHVPPGVHLHPGHTWARLDADGLVSVGIDDFAHKLVGPAAVELPALGAKVHQGDPALALRDGGRGVPLVSPVDGTVVAVNPAATASHAAALDDPYGAGWLFKVTAPRLAGEPAPAARRRPCAPPARGGRRGARAQAGSGARAGAAGRRHAGPRDRARAGWGRVERARPGVLPDVSPRPRCAARHSPGTARGGAAPAPGASDGDTAAFTESARRNVRTRG
jgi:glycine cleavage system H protein